MPATLAIGGLISGIPDLISSGNHATADLTSSISRWASNPAQFFNQLQSGTQGGDAGVFSPFFNNNGNPNTAASIQQGYQNFMNSLSSGGGFYTDQTKAQLASIAQYMVNNPNTWNATQSFQNTINAMHGGVNYGEGSGGG